VKDAVVSHAVKKVIGFGIEEDGSAQFIVPVVVVGDTAQAGFDAAKDDGEVFLKARRMRLL
jgi:hypothetical protein